MKKPIYDNPFYEFFIADNYYRIIKIQKTFSKYRLLASNSLNEDSKLKIFSFKSEKEAIKKANKLLSLIAMPETLNVITIHEWIKTNVSNQVLPPLKNKDSELQRLLNNFWLKN